jgi:hypothetical protein
MKKSNKIVMFTVLIATCILIAFGAQAANEVKKAPNPKQQEQYEKMRVCNAEAKARALKGDEREAFISECLKNEPNEEAQDAPATKVDAGEK